MLRGWIRNRLLRQRIKARETRIKDIESYPNLHPDAKIHVALLREQVRRFRNQLER